MDQFVPQRPPPMSARKPWPKTVTVGHASVKIYRIAHHASSGWIFVLAWKTPTGRRREKFADETEALTEARNKAAELSAGRIEGASMSLGDRDELQAARAVAGNVPLLSALQEWATARAITEGHILPAAEAWAARNVTKHERIKVAEVVTEFLAAKARAGVQTKKNHGHIFEDIKTEFGNAFIDSVAAPQIGAWLAKWESPSTRNTFRKHTVGLWRWAQKQGYLARELKTEAEQTDLAKEGPQKKGIITPETLQALLAHFRKHHPEYLAALVLATFCGLRRGEVHSQIWEHIDLASRRLQVTKAKEGTPAERIVPIARAGVAWLMHCANRKGNICPNLAIDRIRDIARGAKYDLPENCFRHSFITYRAALTQNVPQTAEEAGNSPSIVRKHYKKLMTKSPARAWFDSGPVAAGEVIDMPSENKEAVNA